MERGQRIRGQTEVMNVAARLSSLTLPCRTGTARIHINGNCRFARRQAGGRKGEGKEWTGGRAVKRNRAFIDLRNMNRNRFGSLLRRSRTALRRAQQLTVVFPYIARYLGGERHSGRKITTFAPPLRSSLAINRRTDLAIGRI